MGTPDAYHPRIRATSRKHGHRPLNRTPESWRTPPPARWWRVPRSTESTCQTRPTRQRRPATRLAHPLQLRSRTPRSPRRRLPPPRKRDSPPHGPQRIRRPAVPRQQPRLSQTFAAPSVSVPRAAPAWAAHAQPPLHRAGHPLRPHPDGHPPRPRSARCRQCARPRPHPHPDPAQERALRRRSESYH